MISVLIESGDIKATVAVLSFILSSAAKHNVDGESLSSELQQLGLPKGKTNLKHRLKLFLLLVEFPYCCTVYGQQYIHHLKHCLTGYEKLDLSEQPGSNLEIPG